MDIEGAEAGLLIDDADSLTKCEVVIAELHTRTFRGPNMYHGYHVGASDMVDLFRDLGFTQVRQDRTSYVFVR